MRLPQRHAAPGLDWRAAAVAPVRTGQDRAAVAVTVSKEHERGCFVELTRVVTGGADDDVGVAVAIDLAVGFTRIAVSSDRD